MRKIYLLVFLIIACQLNGQNSVEGFIYMVNGKQAIEKLGFSLTHEHIMSNFGASPEYKANYDSIALYKQVIPYLKKIKSQGVVTVFDCTAAYFGRDVSRLKIISDSSGIQIVTNTGFYGGAKDKYIPEFAFDSKAKAIAKIWIEEFENGIASTGIKPGFIKLAFDDGQPSKIDIKLFKAGIMTHLKTGLSMMVHTANNTAAAKEQLRLLAKYKVHPSAWIWAHANLVADKELLIQAASKGVWISLDGVKESNITEYVNAISFFKERKLLHKILLSHDGNSFPRGGNIRKYEAITTLLIPELLKGCCSADEINQMMIQNPKEAFSTRVRKML
jgi:predicted metal-dependent phosphotriesterase family hydrolase